MTFWKRAKLASNFLGLCEWNSLWMHPKYNFHELCITKTFMLPMILRVYQRQEPIARLNKAATNNSSVNFFFFRVFSVFCVYFIFALFRCSVATPFCKTGWLLLDVLLFITVATKCEKKNHSIPIMYGAVDFLEGYDKSLDKREFLKWYFGDFVSVQWPCTWVGDFFFA